MIFRIGGIIILFFMFKYAIDEFRRAKKENKDPYLAYLNMKNKIIIPPILKIITPLRFIAIMNTR
jgi:hypothetical protein